MIIRMHELGLWLCSLTLLGSAQLAFGQTKPSAPASTPAVTATPAPVVGPTLSASDWLQRMHDAGRERSYVGTFVVSAPGGGLSSARIWHVCEGESQLERVEALSGPPRSTFRLNDDITTFLPQLGVVRREKRERLVLFPGLPDAAPQSSIAEHYDVRPLGGARVAGLDADVVQLVPRDGLRFGYRIWTERRSGLLIKLQTLATDGRVIEQSAFSDLQLDAPIKAQALMQMMNDTGSYRVETAAVERTSAQAEGWALSSPVAGFQPVNCYRRAMGGAASPVRTVQWIFSDGLASVSLFIEPYDAKRASEDALFAMGATYTLVRRIPGKNGDWLLSAVGEVPPQTLEAFAQRLVRRR